MTTLNREQIAKIAGRCLDTGRFNLFMAYIDDALKSQPSAPHMSQPMTHAENVSQESGNGDMSEQVAEQRQDDIERLTDTLRGFSRAYPEDMFPPPNEAVMTAIHGTYPGAIDRISAAMGRHCAKFMAEAADMIDSLSQPSQPAGGTVTDAELHGLLINFGNAEFERGALDAVGGSEYDKAAEESRQAKQAIHDYFALLQSAERGKDATFFSLMDVKRASDQSVQVVFMSCRTASEFEAKARAAMSGKRGGE